MGRVRGPLIEDTAEEIIVGSQAKHIWKAKRDSSSMNLWMLEGAERFTYVPVLSALGETLS